MSIWPTKPSGVQFGFHAEVTLSQFRAGGRHWFTLILRDVEDRLAAEKQIHSLLHETEYLRALGIRRPSR